MGGRTDEDSQVIFINQSSFRLNGRHFSLSLKQGKYYLRKESNPQQKLSIQTQTPFCSLSADHPTTKEATAKLVKSNYRRRE